MRDLKSLIYLVYQKADSEVMVLSEVKAKKINRESFSYKLLETEVR